jgi:hypothetical protein
VDSFGFADDEIESQNGTTDGYNQPNSKQRAREITKDLETLTNFIRELDCNAEDDGELEEKVNLFERTSLNLKKMRDDAQSLPDEERKRFAAMVVAALFPEEDFSDHDFLK